MRKEFDEGNFDMVAKVDGDGRVWFSPSLPWTDGEVYEWLNNGQRLSSMAERSLKEWEEVQ